MKTTSDEIEIRRADPVPPELLDTLSKCRARKWTNIETIFHCIHVGNDWWVGVAGDGANGSYEAFSYRDGVLKVGDKGWGDTSYALRVALSVYCDGIQL